jgi:hypothetical protein
MGATPYDVRVFEALPLYLQGAVLDDGLLAVARDAPALSEYLRPWRKRWRHEARRCRPSDDSMQRVFEARRRERIA